MQLFAGDKIVELSPDRLQWSFATVKNVHFLLLHMSHPLALMNDFLLALHTQGMLLELSFPAQPVASLSCQHSPVA
jgi:hypothetical protein